MLEERSEKRVIRPQESPTGQLPPVMGGKGDAVRSSIKDLERHGIIEEGRALTNVPSLRKNIGVVVRQGGRHKLEGTECEDAILVRQDVTLGNKRKYDLLAVFDGLGGRANSAEASLKSAEFLDAFIREKASGYRDPKSLIVDALGWANDELRKYYKKAHGWKPPDELSEEEQLDMLIEGVKDSKKAHEISKGPASTVTVALVGDDLAVGSIGDSRAYVFRNKIEGRLLADDQKVTFGENVLGNAPKKINIPSRVKVVDGFDPKTDSIALMSDGVSRALSDMFLKKSRIVLSTYLRKMIEEKGVHDPQTIAVNLVLGIEKERQRRDHYGDDMSLIMRLPETG
ncbi:MAG: protein phosphatase 2C domain-containing protein [Candidatus Altiarchaeota archaeon]